MTLAQETFQNNQFFLVDTNLIDVILHHKKKGDLLMFVRSHNGQIRVKIKYGPLKCLVKRFVTNNATFELIKQKIVLKK